MKIRNTYIDGNTIFTSVLALGIVSILLAPGEGSTLARLASSAIVIVGAKVLGYEIDPEAWVTALTW
tara:strand:- start:471 stop:671 length:201 start_codon:yes stop_codon:yes gene_type:complete